MANMGYMGYFFYSSFQFVFYPTLFYPTWKAS